jgi:hypothetical protein
MVFKVLLGGFLLCVLGAPLSAQDLPANELAAISPFVNDRTLAIVRIDLRKLDVEALKKQFIDPALHTEADRAAVAASFEKVKRLVEGVSNTGNGLVFFVYTLPREHAIVLDLPNVLKSAFIVLPKGLPTNVKRELETALSMPVLVPIPFPIVAKAGPELTEMHGVTVLAEAALKEQLASLSPTARPEFAKALSVGRAYPISVAFVSPPNFARAAEQIFLDPAPGTNKPWGSLVGRGVQWIGAGVETNLEKFGVEIVVQSATAEAASALSETLKNLFVADLTAHPPSNNSAINALASAQILSLIPAPKGDQLVLNLTGERAATLGTLGKQLYVDNMKVSWQTQNMNHLKQIALAILNYEDKYHQFPDRAIRDKNGKPLLSWRVAVLPDIDGAGLYKQFHLDEPWDSDHNRKLIERIPETYRSAGDTETKPGYTRYLAAVGENCAFPPDRAVKFKEFTDGSSQTIMVVEAAPQHAVIWTKPDDLEVDLANPLPGIVAGDQDFNAVRADGSAMRYSGQIMPLETLRAYFTRNGGDKIHR